MDIMLMAKGPSRTVAAGAYTSAVVPRVGEYIQLQFVQKGMQPPNPLRFRVVEVEHHALCTETLLPELLPFDDEESTIVYVTVEALDAEALAYAAKLEPSANEVDEVFAAYEQEHLT